MVAFKAAQTPGFIRNPDPRMSAALVYGPDASFVAERARELVRAAARREEPGAEVLRLYDRDLAENPDRLAVELGMRSMFAAHRVIHVRSERRLDPKELESLIAGGMEAFLVVEAGNLRPAAPLRKLFEGQSRAAALPCYADAARDMNAVIEAELTANGVRISREVRGYLASRLGGDPGQARSECAKLALYIGEAGEVTVGDIDAVIGETGGAVADAIASAAAEGRTRSALRQLDSLIASGQSPHAALSAMGRHFQRLHRVCAGIESGEPAKSVLGRFRPPLHFSMRDALLAQSRAWNGAAAARAVREVQRTVRATRGSPALDAELAERLILALGSMTAKSKSSN